MKKGILVILGLFILLMALASPVAASRYAFGEKETFLLYNSSYEYVGKEVSVQIMPKTVIPDGKGMITVLVTIPDDYAGAGAEDLAGTTLIRKLTNIDVDFIGPMVYQIKIPVVFTFILTDGENELPFYGIDEVTFLSPTQTD